MKIFKKILKYFAISFILILAILLLIPFLFKDKIVEVVKESINENLHAQVNFDEVDLNLIRNFPNASIGISNISVINHQPFEGDTLFYAEDLHLKMSIKELFKSADEKLVIDKFSIENGLLQIIYNEEGIANFDAAIKKDEDSKKTETESEPLSLELSEYALENVRIIYEDRKEQMKFSLSELNHEGMGNFNQDILDLDTQTHAFVGFEQKGVTYFDGLEVTLDAVLGIDNKNQKYTFKENNLLLNKLPLSFDGFLQMTDNGQHFDLTFDTPSSDFYHFLGLIPSSFKGDMDDIESSGKLSLGGFVKGLYNESRIPAFDVSIKADNASFKFPDLPKAVKNITINTQINNTTGQLNDTKVNINPLTFSIDQDTFHIKTILQNLIVNPNVDAEVKGLLNLANLTQAYPLDIDYPLSGILKADLSAKFDQQSVDNGAYQNIDSRGNFNLKGFNYKVENGKEIKIKETQVSLTPTLIQLEKCIAQTGESDFNITGNIQNLFGYILSNQTLTGNFTANSNQFKVSDFMDDSDSESSKSAENQTSSEPLKIPKNIDISIKTIAKKVYYDNLLLTNTSGNTQLKDQAIALDNIVTHIFDGQIGLSGKVSMATEKPQFAMNLLLKELNISKSCRELGFLQKILPISDVINGKLNSQVSLSGNLTDALTPEINTLSGELLGQLLSATLNAKNSAVLNEISKHLKFIDPSKLDVNQLKAHLSFQNGKVKIQPFTMKYQDIDMLISGEHGFDQSLNYTVKLDVPAKYLGAEINKALSALSVGGTQTINSVPINLTVGGNFTKPQIKTDLKEASKDMAVRIANAQKDKLLNKGLSEVDDVLKDLKIKNPNDSTKLSIPTSKEELNQKLEDEKKKLEDEAKKKANEEIQKQKKKLLDKVWGNK